MWLITGPFESEQLGDETSAKTKLLKPKRAYGVGRHKGSALTINNKKVSRHNGEFIVGEHLEDEVLNTAFVPTLSLRNTKSAAMKVSRGNDVFIVNPESTYELESGDVVRLASNVNATVMWAPKICFYTPGDDTPAFNLASCAAIGLKLVTKHTRDVTHHIAERITAPLHSSMLLSLLNPASLVTPQWLVEVVRRGQDVDGLEKTYDLPLESNYCPLIDSAVVEQNPSMAKMVPWNLNMKRKGLFDGVRFIFALIGNGNGSPIKAMSDIVIRGGADRQLINVEREAEEQDKGASGGWGTVLKKRKVVLKEGMRSGLVLVGDKETMTANGVPRNVRKAWENMVDKARSVNMRVIDHSLVAEAIFKADVSLIDCIIDEGADTDVVEGSTNSRSLPECIPSTFPEEASQLSGTEVARNSRSSNSDNAAQGASQASQPPVAGPSRRLTRRTASQTPAPEPAPLAQIPVGDAGQSAPKRLKRRANTGGLVNQLLGLDDTTVLEESQLSQGQAVRPDVVLATPARPGRLKRRAGTAAASQSIPELQPSMENREEPTLKKFKALFEESGQGLTSQTDDVEKSSGGSLGVADSHLAVVVEEEEEETQTLGQARKRKANAMEEEEMEPGDDIEMLDAEGPSTAKKRAVEAVNAVERSQKPVSQAAMDSTSRVTLIRGSAKSMKKGAVPGKPDTDPSFLRAIASNKRGKKLEDNFDREFNQLRIAKPVTDTADPSAFNVVQSGREWDGLDDFEKDVGLRGNFMQIVELKVWKDVEQQPGRNVRRESGLGARLDWEGREDFKKFRRKVNNGSREVVKLVLSGQHDYEPEAPHFDYRGNKKSRDFDDLSQSQSQNQSQSHPIFTQTLSGSRSRPKSQPKAKARPKVFHEVVDDEDDEVEAEIGGLRTQSKGKSQASSRGKPSQSTKKQPLFDLDSEEEDFPPKPSYDTLDNDLPDSTLISSKSTTQTQETKRKTQGTKRKLALEEESDSDQGLTFGGFSKKAKRK